MCKFEENKWRFAEDEILYHATLANVPQELVSELKSFLKLANSDDEILKDLWDYYSTLFLTEKLFLPIEKVEDVPVSKKYEEEFPGIFKTVVFLAAARNFEKYLRENNLFGSEFKFLESYYANIRRLMDMNYARDNTYAFVRLSEYLYSYAKPLMLRIGRFAYELTRYENDAYDVYENASERKFAPKTTAKFNTEGYPDKNGKILSEKFNLNGYEKILDDGDYVITMHIPGNDKLTKETIENSLKNAIPILKKVFGKYNPKKIVCTSWLLSPQLREFLKPESNILRFQSYYDIIGWYPNDNSFYEHVFCSPIVPPHQLVPTNNFQKSVLDIYLKGGRLHDGFGILKKEWQI